MSAEKARIELGYAHIRLAELTREGATGEQYEQAIRAIAAAEKVLEQAEKK